MEVYPNQKIHEVSSIQEHLKVLPLHERPKTDQVHLTETVELEKKLRSQSSTRTDKVGYAKQLITQRQYPSEQELTAIAQLFARTMQINK